MFKKIKSTLKCVLVSLQNLPLSFQTPGGAVTFLDTVEVFKEARKLHEAVMNTPADPESDSLSVHEGTGAPKRSFCASVNNAGTNATHGCPSSTTLTQLVM